ncbi:hypothetical protein AB8A21_12520 [Streptomyces sp. BF23-18]|uniref:sodium:solute symporter family transporter n=1 Tax=Streptomyces sp. BF23-18 TaxID=3240282 RepID=UPI0034E5745C
MTDFDSGSQATVLVLFTALVTVTLLMCVMTGPDRDDLTNFYTGYLSLTPFKNGLAIAGDYISAATVLSTSGIIALAGYDGYVLTVSTALSLVLLMFLLAEPLRNAGRFTMGDVLARTMPGRAVRIASCVVTLSATLPFLVVQLSGAGSLLTFILNIPHGAGARTACIVIVGSLMIIYAALGGMRGTALLQMIKIVILLGTSVVVAALVLNRFGWNPGDLLRAAQHGRERAQPSFDRAFSWAPRPATGWTSSVSRSPWSSAWPACPTSPCVCSPRRTCRPCVAPCRGPSARSPPSACS